MLGADQAYEGLYGHGQAPPSVHSSHGGRMFQQGMRYLEEFTSKQLVFILFSIHTIDSINSIDDFFPFE